MSRNTSHLKSHLEPWASEGFFQVESESGEFDFAHSKLRQPFAKNWIGKCQNLKSRGGLRLPSEPEAHACNSSDFSKLKYGWWFDCGDNTAHLCL